MKVKMCIHPIYEDDLEYILQAVDHSAWDSDDDFGPEACQISSAEDGILHSQESGTMVCI